MDRPASLHVGDGGGNSRTVPSVLVVPTDRSCGRKRGGCGGELGIGEGAGNEQGLDKLSLIDPLSPPELFHKDRRMHDGYERGEVVAVSEVWAVALKLQGSGDH